MMPRRIVEIGTSYGVSTLYLAAARATMSAQRRQRRGDRTNTEPTRQARQGRHFEQAGGALHRSARRRPGELRSGRSTVPVDFMLVDIWITMAAAGAGVGHSAL